MTQVNRLNQVLNRNQLDSFTNFQLTNSDIKFVQEVSNEVLKSIPQKAYNCAQLSALLGAVIEDNSNIPVIMVSGHLDYNKKRIFNCKSPIPFSSKKKEINEIWDGHCWIEIPNFTIDNSFFRTIYFGNVPISLKKSIISKFGKGRGSIMATTTQMDNFGLKYTPCYQVNNQVINGLIKSI